MKLTIRRYKPGEEEEIWRLYYDTTHKINGKEYTKEQINRWASEEHDLAKWKDRLRQNSPYVAEHEGTTVGLVELEPDGHIDRFYCHHEWQRKGVGTLLYWAIAEEALRLGISLLNADVSTTAKDFFCRRGFKVVKEQQSIVCGVAAKNFRMEKLLPEGSP